MAPVLTVVVDPQGKTQLRSGGLFFPNAMRMMRDQVLVIERAKRMGSRKGGISCQVRIKFEVSGRE